ncbi:nitroreductase family protein [Streptomyces beihaiensis]|uniref:Nitroreductase n=1 Tax=Streptomyces beihaiensis TaxID=2984495 RepID=A0ABT3U3F0_9ACTN|nr:hypothetical protein [Streptomyces beihaiensis]MCX3062770.1 hypothetical protein [Streptomyces beihaiensis]
MKPGTLGAAVPQTWISAAVAAPSILGPRPWSFRLDPDTPAVEVRAVPDRALCEIDPEGRALHLSVGAAVFNLRVAIGRSGRTPVVRLLPLPSDPGLLAVVRPVPSVSHGAEAGRRTDLYGAIWRRRDSRFPLAARPIPAQLLAELADAARECGAELCFPETEPDPARAPAPTTVIAAVGTEHDRRADWLRAGQALQHVLLVAAAHGLRGAPLHRSMDWSDLRTRLTPAPERRGHVHMLLHLGYGLAAPAAAPRGSVLTPADAGARQQG